MVNHAGKYMDISSMYELRERLKASMIAGTGLISEDFRLRRAIEAFLPMEKAAPIFGKIGALCRKLMEEPDKEREMVLLDTISLLDQVICTQGAVAVSGDLTPIQSGTAGNVITNAPYSVLKTLLDALLSSGSGHYSYVMETHRDHPELFGDYRVKSALVQALGASYAELADQIEKWLCDETPDILPLLYQGFDPQGKREMVRRVHVISSIAGAGANGFYLKQLPDSAKEVRQALLFALRHEQSNVSYVQELVIKERGNAKKTALYVLARMEAPEAEEYFRKYYEKNPVETMSCLYLSQCEWASKFVAESLSSQLAFFETEKAAEETPEDAKKRCALLVETVKAIPGKWGKEVAGAAEKLEKLASSADRYSKQNKVSWDIRSSVGKYTSMNSFVPPILLEALLIHPDEALSGAAKRLYQGNAEAQTHCNPSYFPAAFMAHLLYEDNTADWLSAQLFESGIFGTRKRKDNLKQFPLALNHLCCLKNRGYCIREQRSNPADSQPEVFIHPVTMDIKGAFFDILMKLEDYNTDRCMGALIDEEDEAFCERLGAYLYKRALQEGENRIYYEPLRRCHVKTCAGLLEQYLRHRYRSSQYHFSQWELRYLFSQLPGNGGEKAEEALRVLELVKKKILKPNNWNEEDYMKMVDQLRMEG